MSLELGETWQARYDVVLSDGTAVGNATVTVIIDLPDGQQVNPQFTLTTPNHYDFDYPTGQVGRHVVHASATGGDLGDTVKAWPPDVFHVDDAASMVLLVGLDEAKVQLNISRDVNDLELLDTIARASAAVEARTQLWHRATVVDVFDRATRRAVVLTQRPAIAITSVVEGGVTLAEGSYQLGQGGVVSRAYGWPLFSCGTGQLVVTYLAGPTAVPVDVRQAVLLMVEHFWQTQRGPAARSFSGTVSEQQYDPRGTYSWPRRVAELLEPYLPPPGVA